MELYHKIYKMNPDLTVYLDNPQKLVEHCDEMLSHLTGAQSMDEFHEEKIAVLRDFIRCVLLIFKMQFFLNRLDILIVRMKKRH